MAAKRRTAAEMLEAATNTGAAIQVQDRAVEALAELEQAAQSTMPLGKIRERPSDTRELKTQHVTDLADSIAALGLLGRICKVWM